jgi:CRP-like cAMP-binding protein
MAPQRPPPLHLNRLLSALAPADLALLQPHLRTVVLKLKTVLEQPNRRIGRVYFMDEGIATVMAVAGKQQIEVGLIGREGMSGAPVVLGNHSSPHATYMQVAGSGQCIGAAPLRTAMQASGSLRQSLLKFVQVFMIQTAHTAMANGRANLIERLARWLLMAHDRVERPALPLTHEFLALRLGVRRAGVTETLHKLEGEKLIRASRGQVEVIDRLRLERRAGASYGVPEAEYRRLIG